MGRRHGTGIGGNWRGHKHSNGAITPGTKLMRRVGRARTHAVLGKMLDRGLARCGKERARFSPGKGCFGGASGQGLAGLGGQQARTRQTSQGNAGAGRVRSPARVRRLRRSGHVASGCHRRRSCMGVHGCGHSIGMQAHHAALQTLRRALEARIRLVEDLRRGDRWVRVWVDGGGGCRVETRGQGPRSRGHGIAGGDGGIRVCVRGWVGGRGRGPGAHHGTQAGGLATSSHPPHPTPPRTLRNSE